MPVTMTSYGNTSEGVRRVKLVSQLRENRYSQGNHAISGVTKLNNVMKKLGDIKGTLVHLTRELKNCMDVVKTFNLTEDGVERVTATHIRAGQLRHTYRSRPQTIQKAKCKTCGAETKTACSACRRVWYCCTSCQLEDWGSHRMECYEVVPSTNGETPLCSTIIEENQSQ